MNGQSTPLDFAPRLRGIAWAHLWFFARWLPWFSPPSAYDFAIEFFFFFLILEAALLVGAIGNLTSLPTCPLAHLFEHRIVDDNSSGPAPISHVASASLSVLAEQSGAESNLFSTVTLLGLLGTACRWTGLDGVAIVDGSVYSTRFTLGTLFYCTYTSHITYPRGSPTWTSFFLFLFATLFPGVCPSQPTCTCTWRTVERLSGCVVDFSFVFLAQSFAAVACPHVFGLVLRAFPLFTMRSSPSLVPPPSLPS